MWKPLIVVIGGLMMLILSGCATANLHERVAVLELKQEALQKQSMTHALVNMGQEKVINEMLNIILKKLDLEL